MPPTSSCTPLEPFIKLDPDGQASILDYNVPQESCFKANGYMRLDVNKNCYSSFASAVPDVNFWDAVSELPTSQIYQLLNDDIIAGSASPMTVNAAFLHNMHLVRDGNSPSGNEPKVGGPRPGAKSNPTIGNPRPGANQTTVSESVASTVAGLSTAVVVNQIVKGRRPFITKNFYGSPVLSFLQQPKSPDPGIYLVFHYKVCSYLGDYGAGKTLKTFSLLPGEKTTISVRTFKHKEEHKAKAEHVFDSFSTTSAASLQSTLQTESGWENEVQRQKTLGAEFGGGLQMGLGKIAKVGIGGGVTASSTNTSTMSNHMSALSEAIDTHTSEANSAREVDVNTDVSSASIEETEESTMRQIQNINLSRTLNFVYRQLLQKYVTITYLDDVSIMFYNGYPESRRIVKLNEINDLLNEVLTETSGSPCATVISDTRQGIYRQLCNIYDYLGVKQSFMECVTVTNVDCCDGSGDPWEQKYAHKIPGLSQTYDGKTVPGIILDVQERVLRTDSVVVDALLGQGEALDCYNQKLQDIAVSKAQLENDAMTQQQAIIDDLDTATDKADKYKKVFGPCCEVPQSCCGDCSGGGVAPTS